MSFDELTLSEAGIDIIDGDRGVHYPKQNEFYSTEYCLFLNAKNVTKDGFDFKEKSFITREKDALLRKGKLARNDIVLTTRGTVGNVAFYNNSIPFDNVRINSGMVILRAEKNEYLPEFVYWMFRSNYIQKQIEAIRTGSAQPQLPITIMRTLQVVKPKLCEQKSIAATLSCLDDMIELNNQINKTLEEMAQAIFKSWFVEFEPFKDGEFEESKLGPIPKGWRVGTIGQYTKCILGGTPSRNKAEYWNGNIAWINSGKINEFRIISPSEFITIEGLNNSATKILPQKTTVLAITGATLGQVSLLEIDACANQSVIGILENDVLPYGYIYPYIKEIINEIISHQTGGAQQHINKGNVESTCIIIPPLEVLNNYKAIVNPVYDMIRNNCFENKAVSAIRDTLLPKLMSGEIRVPVEKVV
ncbi:MAG: restriction endonuclease subunit S [Firmicutes bacterium HGW-Firmicutes-13]|nr:MAG: restriction endonuclease subunit S [Firmicutes bacterium HGW-Firmicutes-13]